MSKAKKDGAKHTTKRRGAVTFESILTGVTRIRTRLSRLLGYGKIDPDRYTELIKKLDEIGNEIADLGGVEYDAVILPQLTSGRDI